MLVVVLKDCVTETKDAAWASKISISLAKSASERVSRSTLSAGAGGGEECSRNGLGMRAPLPTTDALFAQEVEQKMNNLLGWFWRRAIIPGSNQTSHRDAACSC